MKKQSPCGGAADSLLTLVNMVIDTNNTESFWVFGVVILLVDNCLDKYILLHIPHLPSIITTNIKREEVLTMTSAIESNIRTNNNGRAGSASVA